MDQNETPHGGLFPECLKAEYHGIRSAIEAHARSAVVEDREQGTANGIALSCGNSEELTVRATAANGVQQTYCISWSKED